MTGVQQFEDLIAWQKARQLSAEVYALTREPPLSRDFALSDQLRRASVSVMSNIAEGFERGSSIEFRRFLFMAKGSCAELRSQLYVALDAGYVTPLTFDRLMALAVEASKVTGGLVSSLERRIQEERRA